MKVAAVPVSYTYSKKVSFGDDGWVPPSYTSREAMKEMSQKGYVIRGTNNKDAFTRMYTDVEGVLKEAGKRPGYIPKSNYHGGASRDTKYIVHGWEMKKEAFVETATKYWENVKGKTIKDSRATVDEFLVNVEKMKKPNFFQMFTAKGQDFLAKSNVLHDVTEFFIKLGKHALG